MFWQRINSFIRFEGSARSLRTLSRPSLKQASLLLVPAQSNSWRGFSLFRKLGITSSSPSSARGFFSSSSLRCLVAPGAEVLPSIYSTKHFQSSLLKLGAQARFFSESEQTLEPEIIDDGSAITSPYSWQPFSKDFVPRHRRKKVVPPPRYGITKDIFLNKIGKGCEEHIDKFESWEKLFTLRSLEMRKLGVPTKQRRWILRWTEKYRQGIEPYAIRFKSRSVKHKSRYLENRRIHSEQEAAARRKKRKEKEKAKIKLKKELNAAARALAKTRKMAARQASATSASAGPAQNAPQGTN